MVKSTQHYLDLFRTCIMNRLYSLEVATLSETYEWLKSEIPKGDEENEAYKNLEQAYRLIRKDIFG
ncbi:hypothetical protein JOD44_000079 [Salimicrobium jeotgali]|nr:hypothetical protein [Salimicrobium jeotgali]